MRSLAETKNPRSPNLRNDVERAISTLEELRKDISHLHARLYRTAPILWLVQTDRVSYLEQYHFWPDYNPDLNLPVLRYEAQGTSAESPDSIDSMHEQLEQHFNFVWDHCSIDLEEYSDRITIGSDEAIEKAGIGNIYFDRDIARERLVSLIGATEELLCIKGVTLHSFLSDGPLREALWSAIQRGVKTQLLLIDPDCEQAKIRAFREYRIRHRDADWSTFSEGTDIWNQVVLYRDVKDSIELALQLSERSRDKDLDVRLYNSGPECFMLLTDEAVLVEQYHYGKIVIESGELVLGSEVPLVEYENRSSRTSRFQGERIRPQDDVYELFRNHFDYVFEHLTQKIDEPIGIGVPATSAEASR